MSEYDDWRHHAACQDKDPELFFPVSDTGPGARIANEAKAICARCPVSDQCLRHALDNGLDHGIFGGATEAERRRLRRGADLGPAA